MMKNRIFPGLAIAAMIVAGFGQPSFAQAPAERKEQPKSAFVKLINACEVKLPQPWKAGLDLSFKEGNLATDIRSGEKSSYRKISFTGKDLVLVKRTGSNSEAASVPASFEEGCFYTLLVCGMISGADDKIVAVVRKDFPADPAAERRGFARVNVINAISSFPITLKAGDKSKPLAPGQSIDEYFTGGEQSLDIAFSDQDRKERVAHNALALRPDNSYSAIIVNSTEGGNRPLVLKSCETMEIQETIKQEEEAKSDRKKVSGSPP